MAGRHSGRMVRGLRCGGRPAFRLASATIFAATEHLRRSLADCAFRFGKPMLAVWRIASIAPTLNARIYICQISLRPIARTALTHGLVNGFGWQRTAAPLAPCCNGCSPKFLPLGLPPHSLARWGPRRRPFLAEPRNPGLHRPPLRCGPAGAAGQAPAFNQPSRPRMSAGFDQHKELNHGKYRHIQKVRRHQLHRRNRHDELAEEERHHRRRGSERERKRPLAPGVRGEGRNRCSWTKTSKEGRDYLSIKLDDPSFNAPIFASLFADEDGKTHNLIWSRARTSNGN